MNEFISPSSFLPPVYVANSAWLRHIPFAYWLTEKLKPSIFVELGVHTGVSYFSFCYSINTNGINCTCYGVDTWQGDEHAGFYNDDIYKTVLDYNETHYAGFSYLLRRNFNEARESFTDGSIDLLHIDGYHTYEAAKYDFENWLPKLSKKAVVLFHDIKVREKDFGVYSLWDELKEKFPHFEFSFGYGLGVLAVGSLLPHDVAKLFSISDPNLQFSINKAYERLGNSVKDQLTISVLAKETQTLESGLQQQQSVVNMLEKEKASLLKLNENLKQIEKEQQFLLEDQQQLISAQKNKAEEKHQELQAAQKENEKISVSYAELVKTIGWYQRTYEQRSFPGLLKQRLAMVYRKIKNRLVTALLKKQFIINKHVLAFLLGYLRDHGVRKSFTAYAGNIKSKGFAALLYPRKLALEAMQKKDKFSGVRLFPPVKKVMDRKAMEKEIEEFDYLPAISIILTTYNTRPDLLIKAIESVKNQTYRNWELCIADDGSVKNNVRETLQPFLKEQNIKGVFLKTNEGISAASNAAIGISTGEFIALMDHDDELTPDALFWIAKKLNDNPAIDILYTDECKIDEQGNLSDFFYKPDWSPELLLNMMYAGHLTVYRKRFLLESVGLFRKEFDFSQDYDLMLRATEKTTSIVHIDKVLYYWRLTAGSASQGEKPYARKTNISALEDAMKRRKITARIIELPTANRAKIDHPSSLVSIIIPTDSKRNLAEAIRNIQAVTTYKRYEIIAVTNSALISDLKNDSPASQDMILVPYDQPYNFSDKCNQGVAHANGEIIIIYNDDVLPLQGDWIENTIEFLYTDGVGAVSPKLLYEDDSIQYAGMASGVRNLTGTTFHSYKKDSIDYINFPQMVRNVSILSGACFAIKKSVFKEIGGFDVKNTPIAHSDVDISFKLLEKGYRCVYTPYATMRHFGHQSLAVFKKHKRNPAKDKSDIYLLKRWPSLISDDPYFTQAMREHLYHDSPEYFKIYEPANKIPLSNYRKQDILIVSHELTLSGAPMMLLQACRILISNGCFVTVVCDQDGPLRKVLSKAGVIVIIDILVLQQHASFLRFARNYDLVICNTIVTWPAVKQLTDHVEILWWLHEGKTIESFANNPVVAELLTTAHIITVSDYASGYLKKHKSDFQKIRNGCADIANTGYLKKNERGQNEKIILSVIGTLEHRKGQDILIAALQYIPRHYYSRIEIWLIGRVLDPAYESMLKEITAPYDFVKLKGGHEHDEALALMAVADVIICPSRDDPFPVVLIEAFCLSKACVVSTHTGQCEIIEDGVSGFIFNNEDPMDLAGKIALLIENRQLIKSTGLKARKVFERYLTLDQFEKKLMGLINNSVISEKMDFNINMAATQIATAI